MFKKAPFFPSQPRRIKTRLSTAKAFQSPSPPLAKGEWGDFERGAYTGVREHNKGPICLREAAPADMERRWHVGRSFCEGWRTFSTSC